MVGHFSKGPTPTVAQRVYIACRRHCLKQGGSGGAVSPPAGPGQRAGKVRGGGLPVTEAPEISPFLGP